MTHDSKKNMFLLKNAVYKLFLIKTIFLIIEINVHQLNAIKIASFINSIYINKYILNDFLHKHITMVYLHDIWIDSHIKLKGTANM